MEALDNGFLTAETNEQVVLDLRRNNCSVVSRRYLQRVPIPINFRERNYVALSFAKAGVKVPHAK